MIAAKWRGPPGCRFRDRKYRKLPFDGDFADGAGKSRFDIFEREGSIFADFELVVDRTTNQFPSTIFDIGSSDGAAFFVPFSEISAWKNSVATVR